MAQIARRIHERKACIDQIPSLPSVNIIKQNAKNEIEVLQCMSIIITPKSPNNTVILKTGQICTINKIYLENNIIKFSVHMLQRKEKRVCLYKPSKFTHFKYMGNMFFLFDNGKNYYY